MTRPSVEFSQSACTVRHAIETQLSALVLRMRISSEQPRRLLDALVGEALNGPFHDGRRRFSAINGDGVPFQWSVCVGSRCGGLRFVADCGVPGTSISERVRYCRDMLAAIGDWLPLGDNALSALDVALKNLLPPAELLDASLMGLCVAAELARDGTAHLKVYVNGEVGDVRDRYWRFEQCLAAFNRRVALQQLRDLVRAVGDRMVPAFVALDLGTAGIGRMKLYFRPSDGTPALQALASEAAGCSNAPVVLSALHDSFLTGPAYPPKAVDMSVEFPAEDREPGFKVDLRTADFLNSDADVDLRIRNLIEILGDPSLQGVAQIAFVGLASRMSEHQVDVYFHPAPRKAAFHEFRQEH